MNETLPTNFSNDHEWFSQPFSSSSSIGFSSMASSESNSSTTHQTYPSSKPIKRRSRSSKRTPATLLNANTTNFRALVQQFTGCPRSNRGTTGSSSLLGCQKGPVNLNFQLGRVSVQNDHSTNHEASTMAAGFGNNFNGYDQSVTQQQEYPVVERNSVVDDDLEMMMVMGDGVDLTDDIASDLQQQPVCDHNFDPAYFWNYMHNNNQYYPSLSYNNN